MTTDYPSVVAPGLSSAAYIYCSSPLTLGDPGLLHSQTLNPSLPPPDIGMDLQNGLADTLPPTSEPPPEILPSLKRPAGELSSSKKRAKYTTNACKQCKKRKLKCIRGANELECQRCLADGATCVVGPSSTGRGRDVEADKEAHEGTMVGDTEPENPRLEGLTEDISRLQQQVTSLIDTLRELTEGRSRVDSVTSMLPHQQVSPAYSSTNARMSRHRSPEPMQPHFVGPTRSAFSLRIAETSLTRMGIGSNEAPPLSVSGSRAGSPGPSSPEPPPTSASGQGPDPLLSFPPAEIVRLLDVFQEEVESVYPFVETADLAANVIQIINIVGRPDAEAVPPHVRKARQKDLRIIKIAVATGIVVEAHGRNDASTRLIDSVESEISITSRADVDLKEVQANTMLSIYYFHCDEELLAWRLIGTAARAALEMGLHRKQSLVDNFPDMRDRNLAVRVFWCIYALDRRWSFGTSLSFALHDRDIDPELPEPGEDFQYLGCMVGYGRLCSRLWEALPPFGSSSNCIPKDTVAFLDYMAQNWLASIPRELQLRHPRLGLAPRMQPRVLHRLRTLLYLRGNHIRTMIHRHHVLSTAAIESDIRAARNVVDIAQDSLQVLVHLNDSSDIYARQQSAFNYFLLSSLAVIFLAVCHAPATFGDQCRDSFLAALELVKGFSRHGNASRRLWKSIRGLVPRVNSLGLRPHGAEGQNGTAQDAEPKAENATAGNPQDPEVVVEQQTDAAGPERQLWHDMWPPMDAETSPCLSSSVPDAFHMSVDLMSLFDAFGMPQDSTMASGPFRTFDGMLGTEDAGEISRRFQGLI